MTFVFWQNIISIHQKAFLEALCRQEGVGEVILVASHDITHYRKTMGWEVPELKGITIIVSPTTAEAKELVSKYKDAIHVMGGIRIGHIMTVALDACIAQRCRLGVMTEPYDAAGYKGLLRTGKYLWYKLKYFKHIQLVLAIGRQGVQQYKNLGYSEQRLFSWAYFIDIITVARTTADNDLQRIIYAGRIDERKGIYRFVYELAKTGRTEYELDIYGTGPEEPQLKALIANKGLQNKVRIQPFVPYDELVKQYHKYDWVVLPSTGKDGWGVIISEGLMNGLKAICSNMCGASQVVNEKNGVVFDWREKDSCSNAIGKMLENKGFAAADEISAQAKQTISGDAGAKYFMNIIGCTYNQQARPVAPWVK